MNASSNIGRALSQVARCGSARIGTSAVASFSLDAANALVYRAPDDVRLAASQQRKNRGEIGNELEGVTVTVKDNICTRKMPTTCSSRMLQDFNPPYDATVVKLLENAGADIVGKTNCDEFGMGSLNIHSIHGPVVNPFSSTNNSVQRSAGGSSGGSAAAVAAGLSDVSLGTDTGGSIRLPASYCGIVGLKPSYGLISRWGVVSFADSLDCVGIMARNVSGAKRVFDVLSVFDYKDPTAASTETRKSSFQTASIPVGLSIDNLSGLRIGVPQEYFPAEISPSVVSPIRNILSGLRARGATIVPVSLSSTPYALSAYYVISSAEASSNMARYDGVQYGFQADPLPGSVHTKTSNVYARTRTVGFGREVKKRILLGTYALTADAFDNYFLQAQRVRQLIKRDFDRVFLTPNVLNHSASALPALSDSSGVHVLIHPSAIRTAPPLAESAKADLLSSYVQDVLTVPASLAGLPALSVPAYLAQDDVEAGADGWPVGVSVVGQWGNDNMVLRVGEVVESIVKESS